MPTSSKPAARWTARLAAFSVKIARGELVVAGTLGGAAQILEQHAAHTRSARLARDVDAVLGDAGVHAAVEYGAGAREADGAPPSSPTRNGRRSPSHAATSAGVRRRVSKVASRSSIPSL